MKQRETGNRQENLNFKAHSQRHSFSSKAVPPKRPQTVPSAGDQVLKFLGDILIQNMPRPSEFIDRSHPDQFSIRTLHTENMGHTLHADHTPTTQTTLRTRRSHQAPQITPGTHGCAQTYRVDMSAMEFTGNLHLHS